MTMFSARKADVEKRKHTRHQRNFQVQIENEIFEGIDISENGFSLKLDQPRSDFMMTKPFLYVRLIADTGYEYSLKRTSIKSFRIKDRSYVYGFHIDVPGMQSSIKHNMLVAGMSPRKVLNRPQPVKPKTVEIPIAALNKLIETVNEEMFDDHEKVVAIKKYLGMIEKHVR